MNALHLVLGLGIAVSPVPASAPVSGLAPCLHIPFRGVTQTLPTGEVVGEPDAGDWGCLDGRRGSGSGGGTRTLSEADVPVPPPSATCLRPAAPNPMTSATQLGLTLAQSAPVRLSIYGQRWRHGPREVFLVRTLYDGMLAAGVHSVMWDRTDASGQTVPAGIYRVVIEIGGQAACGDVEVQ